MNKESEIVYLDNASTTPTPDVVIAKMNEYYRDYRANIHRGLHQWSQRATEEFERARQKIADFIGAAASEVVFTSGATFGLNALVQTLCRNLGAGPPASQARALRAGDSVVLSRLEHHANLVPWQEMAKQRGFTIKFFEMDFDLSPIDETTKIVSVTHVSNALGTILPIKEIIAKAKAADVITIIDAAQSAAHMPIDVKELDCDFLVFSGHKMYGPTGIGVLYGKKERLASLPPFLFGGDMVREVTYETATYMDAPQKFEAGTPNIAGAIGLGAAVEYIESIGWETIQKQEKELRQYAWEKLQEMPGVRLFGTANDIGIISFTIDGIHPHDVATILDKNNVAVRAGHHCAMPLMKHLGIPGTVRISFSISNEKKDIDQLLNGLKSVHDIFVRPDKYV